MNETNQQQPEKDRMAVASAAPDAHQQDRQGDETECPYSGQQCPLRADVPPAADASDAVDAEGLNEACRRNCKRHFWTELLRTVAKVAGVVLAAMGLSSFGQED